MKAIPDPIPTDRHLAVELHMHYVVVGGVNTRQEVVLPPRRFERDDWLKWTRQKLVLTDTLVVEATTNAWDFTTCDQYGGDAYTSRTRQGPQRSAVE